MWIVLCLGLTFGLLASSWASSTQEVKVRGCSHMGVFYVQGDERHSLNFTQAQQLCEELGATLANEEQLQAANATGLEICRYGWISDGRAAIVRQTSNSLCRNGLTGVFIIKVTDTQYDAFCVNETDTSEKNCENAVNLHFAADPVPPQIADTMVTTLPPNVSATEENTTEEPEDKDHVTTNDAFTSELLTATISLRRHYETDAQTTQVAILEITEPAESLSTWSSAQPEPQTQQTTNEDEAKKRITTSRVHVLETPGSGMGEAHIGTEDTTEYTQGTTHADTEEGTHIMYNHSEAPDVNERKMNAPPEDKSDSGSSDWLIIVGVIVAVAAILLVCAAVATRKRWCGTRQTLMITSKSSSEGNGAAASVASSRAQEREQEMVTLMNKEKIQENGNTEEFTVITLEESPEKNQQA